MSGWIGVRLGVGVWGCPMHYAHACMHAHTCKHAHTHTHMHVKHDKHGCLQGGSHLQFLCMYTCVCTCVETPAMPPDTPRHPLTHLSPPHSCREPKTPKFNKSWTNWDNSILFKDSLPLNTPELIVVHPGYPTPTCFTPRAKETQIRKIIINLEQIEIIQFCLKIWDPWTLLHTYRLGLICR